MSLASKTELKEEFAKLHLNIQEIVDSEWIGSDVWDGVATKAVLEARVALRGALNVVRAARREERD